MLANNLRYLRKKHNLTQTEFGKIFGVDRSTVSKWERDDYKPNLETLTEIAKFFKVTVDELTGVKKNNDEDLEQFINYSKDNSVLSKKSITILLVPIINIALLLSIIVSLLAVLVPTYNGYNNQDNDYKLIYSNIESVSMKLYVPNELPKTIKFHKSSNPFNQKYYLNDLNVVVYDNPAEIEELFTLFTVIVLLKNGMNIDLPRTNRLLIAKNSKYVFESENDIYLCFNNSGVYDIEFYIENETGYIRAYLSY